MILPGSNVARLKEIQAEKRRTTNADMAAALDPRRPLPERRAALAAAMGGPLHVHPGHARHRHPGSDFHVHDWPKV